MLFFSGRLAVGIAICMLMTAPYHSLARQLLDRQTDIMDSSPISGDSESREQHDSEEIENREYYTSMILTASLSLPTTYSNLFVAPSSSLTIQSSTISGSSTARLEAPKASVATITPTSSSSSDDGKLSDSAAAGIGIASTIAGILVLTLVGLLIWRRRKEALSQARADEEAKARFGHPTELGTVPPTYTHGIAL